MSKLTITPFIRFVLLVGSLAWASSLAWSTPAVGGDIDQASEVIRNARGAFRVTSTNDVALARADSVERMNALGAVLDAAGRNGQAWKEYFLWEQLSDQLTADGAPDVTELARLLERFTRDQAGLELPAIMHLRASLRRYYFRALAVDDPQVRAEFDQRLEHLGELVEALRKTRDSATLQEMSLLLSWFEQREQVPAVVAAVLELAPAANIRIRVSKQFIARMTHELIDRRDPMTDCILGTTLHGMSHLVGTMELVPVSGDGEVRMEARLRGDASTTARGYHGPVRANLVGVASVQAAGTIRFGEDGFHLGQTVAHVSAQGHPTSMWTTCNSRLANALIRSAAERRATRTQAQGDCIASRHAEQRMELQLADELGMRVGEMQRGFQTQFRNPLLRHETFPRQFKASSDSAGAQVEMLLASCVQTGAPHLPPVTSFQAALHAQIHETAMNNLSASLLAGRTVSEAELRAFLRRLFTGEAAQMPVAGSDSLQIVLARQRPLTVHVDDSVIAVKVRADRFIKNRSKFPAMNMTLRYRVEQSAAGVRVTRASAPEVVPRDFESKGRRRLGAREIAARRLITRMLDRDLAKTYQFASFTLPKPADQLGTLVVTALNADRGWLDIGLERK